MEQEVFHLELETVREIVALEKEAVEEIAKKVRELNGRGWKVDHIFPISFKTGMLCHDDELFPSHMGFLCTKQS